MTSPYEMKLDLRVLQHLGIGLYSNAAAVLSEAVANAWDADATNVLIDLDGDKIAIDDDGVGMNLDAINHRFLSVGYDKRSNEGEYSVRSRRFMGRKGIGKLALFSIADVISIHTISDGEKHAFRMELEAIETAIKRGEVYRPLTIEFSLRERGTLIELSGLKKKRTASSEAALRKRIARRFSIIAPPYKTDEFRVLVNGSPISEDDREDLKSVEFLWRFGDEIDVDRRSYPGIKKVFTLPGEVPFPDGYAAELPWTVRGWLGAVSEPKKLKRDDTDSLNGLVVLARGRLIQENILDKLNFNKLLGNYVTGQIEADFLDSGDQQDIATSDRQRLVEDDHRYVALRDFLRKVLGSISEKWSTLRNQVRGEEAVQEHPSLARWISTLPSTQQAPARKLLGIVRGVELEDEEQRGDLYRSGILAFERLRLREESHRLLELEALTAATLLPLLSDLSTLEGSLYLEIVRTRLDVIQRFEDLVDADEKEKVLQEHLFDNLWLLDPGWERAAGSERIEQTLRKEFSEFSLDLTDDESKGRVDIRYRTNGGEHIIVELKRARRRLQVGELVDQGMKYRSALQKCLSAAGTRGEPHISVVFVVGRALAGEVESAGRETIDNTLKGFNGRVVHYEELIAHAREAYSAYLEQRKKHHLLDSILSDLGQRVST